MSLPRSKQSAPTDEGDRSEEDAPTVRSTPSSQILRPTPAALGPDEAAALHISTASRPRPVSHDSLVIAFEATESSSSTSPVVKNKSPKKLTIPVNPTPRQTPNLLRSTSTLSHKEDPRGDQEEKEEEEENDHYRNLLAGSHRICRRDYITGRTSISDRDYHISSKQLLPEGSIFLGRERSRPDILKPQLSRQESYRPMPTKIARDMSSASLEGFKPGALSVPGYLMWISIGLTALCVGVVNFVMVLVDSQFVSWKFNWLQEQIIHDGILGASHFIWFSVWPIAISAAICMYISPIIRGSGLPEIKGYLNGYDIPGLFVLGQGWARIVCMIFVVFANLPVGREGPMVLIGGMVGHHISRFVLKPWLKRVGAVTITVGQNEDGAPRHQKNCMRLLDDLTYGTSKRIVTAIGGACGVAVSFGAPMGGLVYMWQEVTGVLHWTHTLTLQMFCACIVAVICSRELLKLLPLDLIHQLVLFPPPKPNGYEASADHHHAPPASYHLLDLPFFILIGFLCGLLAVVFTLMKVTVWKTRTNFWKKCKDKRGYNLMRIAEASLMALFVGIIFTYSPMAFSCKPVPENLEFKKSHMWSDNRDFFRYNCQENFFSEIASLFWKGEESAVKHLYARTNYRMEPSVLATTLVLYMPLAALMAALTLPMGMFIPTLFIGALVGRMIGEFVKMGDFINHGAVPGAYALVGSGAMLGGFTHMSIAIVVLLCEVTGDIEMAIPICLAVVVSVQLSDYLLHHPYDEELVLLKGVPLLSPDVPCVFDAQLDAETILETLPTDEWKIRLQAKMNLCDIQTVLDRATNTEYFPVFQKGKFEGTVSRARLGKLIRQPNERSMSISRKSFTFSNPLEGIVDNMGNMTPDCNSTSNSGNKQVYVNLLSLAELNPTKILGSTPSNLTYLHFSDLHAHHVAVVDPRNHLIGIISRKAIHDTIRILKDKQAQHGVDPLRLIRKKTIVRTLDGKIPDKNSQTQFVAIRTMSQIGALPAGVHEQVNASLILDV